MKRYATKPLDMFQLLGNWFTDYGPILRQTWRITLTMSLMSFALNSLIQMSAAAGKAGSLMHINFMAGPIALIPGVLLLLLLYGIFLVKTDAVLSERPIKFSAALTRVKPRYFPMLGTILLFLAILLAFVVVGLGIGYLLTKLHLGAALAPLTIVVAIVMVAVWLYFYFAVVLVLFDNSKVLASFKSSYRLVRHHWWHTFATMLVAVLLTYIAGLFLTALISLIFWGDMTLLTYNDQEAATLSGLPLIAANVVEVLISALLYPAAASVILLLFNDLKVRKEQLPRDKA